MTPVQRVTSPMDPLTPAARGDGVAYLAHGARSTQTGTGTGLWGVVGGVCGCLEPAVPLPVLITSR